MKKKTSKLTLNRVTVRNLHLEQVAGGITEESFCAGYTCYRQCQPVPSVDGCPTRLCVTDPCITHVLYCG